MIAASVDAGNLRVRLSGSERFLAWPEPAEVLVPIHAIVAASTAPTMGDLPDLRRIFWSLGRGFRTLPVMPGRWVFGRRRIASGRFFFALRDKQVPVLIVRTQGWTLDGAVVSTPQASELAARLAPSE